MRHFTTVLFASLSLGGCISAPPLTPPAEVPRFDALTFFTGHTVGTGSLRTIFASSQKTDVHGTGHIEDGTLVLDRTVRESNKPTKCRTWRIRQDAPGHYSGTLTDASGPIVGESEGNRLHLAFTMKGGLPTEQWLILARDGRSAHNMMVVKKFGVRVAVLDEDIVKTD